MLGALFTYALLMGVLGFALATFLLVFLLIRGLEHKPWWAAGLAALGMAVLTHVVFRTWLRVQLPLGIFGF